MMITTKTNSRSLERLPKWVMYLMVFAGLLGSHGEAFAALTVTLQGQNAGNTNWTTSALSGWQELDYVPVRVRLSAGPATNQTVTIIFDHSTSAGIPEIENLTGFTATPNVSIVSPPVLSAPPGALDWSYSFNVSVANAMDGFVEFRARLSAGMHRGADAKLDAGSTTLTIHKPGSKSGHPDLTASLVGPSNAPVGSIIEYVINFTNEVAVGATGVQVSDVLPAQFTYVAGSATAGGFILGDTLTWDLGALPAGASGSVSFKATVSMDAAGQTVTNRARIYSAEDDAQYSDNTDSLTNVVTSPGCPTCVMDYPYVSANPLTSVVFNESEVLRGFSPIIAGHGDTIKVWYNDEHALTLGVRRVIVKTASGTTTNDYPLTPLTGVPGGATNPAVGTLALTGNQAGTDLANRPMFPALFITDITDDPTSKAGDWQFGGTAIPPHAVFGTWKGAVRTIDQTKTPATVSILPDTDPAKNDWNLGAGDPAPAGLKNEGYGAEVRWNVDDLGLTFGRMYRFYFMVHDGDQNNSGGDTGHACLNVCFTKPPTNLPPVANDDAYTVNEDGILTVGAPGVLANDTDPNTNALTAMLVSGPAHGALTFNPDGSFSYAPTTNYHGPDSFTYKASDGLTNSDTATVSITVVAVNDAPVAANDAYTIAEDSLLTVPAPGVLANDTDLDGDPLTAMLVNAPAHGALTLSPDGSFVYQPNTDFNGTDSFSYWASDGLTNSGPAIVTITVTPVNDAPVANPDAYTVNEDSVLTVAAPGVLANDTDADGDPLTAMLVSGPSHGTLTLLPNGSFTYTPATNYNGPDSFTYKANDGLTNSAPAAVTITVNAVNDRPVANPDAYTINEDTTLTVAAPGVLANDTDADGDPLTAMLVSGPSHGTLTLSTNGSFVYRPNTNFNGPDSFTYKANDGRTNSVPAAVTITVNAVNDAPVANPDAYTISEDSVLTVAAPGVLANDSDADGDALTAVLVTGPAHGTLTLSTNGSFVYRPATNFNGTDSFTYVANDGTTNSAPAPVAINVTPANDAPVAVSDAYTINEDTLLTVAAPGVLANDSDADGDPLRAALVSGPAHGALTFNTNGSFTYLPATNFHGTDSFTYVANDGTTNSAPANVTITVNSVNDSPVVANDSYSLLEDNLFVVAAPGVLANDFDADGDVLSVALVAGPAHGSLTLNTDGSFTYRPATNYNGPDSFTYRASDGTTNTAPAIVSLTVLPVNDPPSFVKGPDQLVPENSGPAIIANWAASLSAGPPDEAGQTLTFIITTDHPELFTTPPAVGTNGTLTFAPAANVFGLATVTARLRDDGGTANGGVDTSDPQTFTITVNSPPIVNIITPTNGTFFMVPASFPVIADAFDPDGFVTQVELFQGTNRLAVFTNAPYQVPRSNLPVGTYQFSARATDNHGAVGVSQPVNVTVLPTAPLVVEGELLDAQVNLFELSIRVDNPTPFPFPAVRVLISNLPPGTVVANASGTNASGAPFVQYNWTVPPGGSAPMVIEYMTTNRQPAQPGLSVEIVQQLPAPAPAIGTFVPVTRMGSLTGDRYVIGFDTTAGRDYFIEYSNDLASWKTAATGVHGFGNFGQWVDTGAPKTESHPSLKQKRFYRVRLAP